ncbi:hypothetical protein AA313_de0200358 [Arthrobotrys entomopaga]|nr:hypothetical protein AA313_de0200358 [Arthrobotrys entomopaga]
MKTAIFCTFGVLTPTVLSHCLITKAWGNANSALYGYGIGLLEGTDRTKDDQANGQRDCAIFGTPPNTYPEYCEKCPAGFDTECADCKGVPQCKKCPLYDYNCPACRQRNTDGCGRTLARGSSNYYSTASDGFSGELLTGPWINWMIANNRMPQVTAGGWLWINMYQQTTDGAGPYTCKLDQTGQGTNWQNLTVPVTTVGVQGANPCNDLSWVWPLQLPTDLKCTGKYKDENTGAPSNRVCIIRCQNDAPNGPFGGCVPFEQVEKSRTTLMQPPSFEKVQKCTGFQYKKPLSDGSIRFLAGDYSIKPAAMAAIRAMLP